MPFGPQILLPSIALSLLKASLKPTHISCKVLYLTLLYAKRIGSQVYRDMSNAEPTMQGFLGEWLFSGELFPNEAHDIEGYIENVLRGKSPGFGAASKFLEAMIDQRAINQKTIDDILAMRAGIKEFVGECVEKVLAHRPRIVGFTSTFQQHVASLTLAKQLKARDKNLYIVFGGANCEGVMGWETFQQFPFIDAVVSGEGDHVFAPLIRQVLDGERPTEAPGLFLRKQSLGSLRVVSDVDVRQQTTAPVENMDSLPYPDFEDFFEQFESAGLEFPDLGQGVRPRLMFETSRGCWWGAKAHCSFCGLNGSTMAYRSKSADRAIDELTYMLDKYPGSAVSVVDNILDMKYFRDFIPKLAERKLGAELFYEVKSNLTKSQVRMMRDAGILVIQPGIESFSSHVLDLMKKGVSSLQNIQLLKWCREHGIRPYWNMLCGFPGETPEDYDTVYKMLPLISHLQPPGGYGLIRLDRFSPNFNESSKLGFTDVRPYPAYDYIYKSLDDKARSNMAVFFTFNYRDERDVMSYVKPIVDLIPEWHKNFPESDVFSVEKADHLLVWDFRPVAVRTLTIFKGLAKTLFEACDGISNISRLQKVAQTESAEPVSLEQIEETLSSMIIDKLMLKEGNSYLNLAIPLGEYSPPALVIRKFENALRSSGKTEGNNIILEFNPTNNAREVSPQA